MNRILLCFSSRIALIITNLNTVLLQAIWAPTAHCLVLRKAIEEVILSYSEYSIICTIFLRQSPLYFCLYSVCISICDFYHRFRLITTLEDRKSINCSLEAMTRDKWPPGDVVWLVWSIGWVTGEETACGGSGGVIPVRTVQLEVLISNSSWDTYFQLEK